jgi:hypothetical protein
MVACFVSFITKTTLDKIKIGSGVEYIKDALFLGMASGSEGQPVNVWNQPPGVQFQGNNFDFKKELKDEFTINMTDPAFTNRERIWTMVWNRREVLFKNLTDAVAQIMTLRQQLNKPKKITKIKEKVIQLKDKILGKTPDNVKLYKVKFDALLAEVTDYHVQLVDTVGAIAQLQLELLAAPEPNSAAGQAPDAAAAVPEATAEVRPRPNNVFEVEYDGKPYTRVKVAERVTEVMTKDDYQSLWNDVVQDIQTLYPVACAAKEVENLRKRMHDEDVFSDVPEKSIMTKEDFTKLYPDNDDVSKMQEFEREFTQIVRNMNVIFIGLVQSVRVIERLPVVDGYVPPPAAQLAASNASAATTGGGDAAAAGSEPLVQPPPASVVSTPPPSADAGGGDSAAASSESLMQASPAGVSGSPQSSVVQAGSGGPGLTGVALEMKRLNDKIEAQDKELKELTKLNGQAAHFKMKFDGATDDYVKASKEKLEWKGLAEKMWNAIDDRFKTEGVPIQSGEGVKAVNKLKDELKKAETFEIERNALETENKALRVSINSIDATLTARLMNGVKREDVVKQLVALDEAQSAFLKANTFTDLNDITTKKGEWIQKISQLQGLCDQARIEVTDLRSERDAHVAQIQELEGYHRCIDYVMDVNHLNHVVDQEAAFGKLCDDHFAEFKRIKASLTSLSDENKALLATIQQYENVAKANAGADPTTLQSRLETASSENLRLQGDLGSLNTKLQQAILDMSLETGKLKTVTQQYNDSQQQAEIYKNTLAGCRRELAAEKKQHSALQASKAATGGAGPKASHADTSATVGLDDTVSRLLLQLQVLRHPVAGTSINDKARQIAQAINRSLDGIGSRDAKVEIFRLIMKHLGITGGNTQ